MTDITETVERVARALCEESHFDPDADQEAMGGRGYWVNFVSAARAAIDAMSETDLANELARRRTDAVAAALGKEQP